MGRASHPIKNANGERTPGPEASLRLLVEQLPALAWATDRDLRILWMIGTGFRPLDPPSLVGRDLREVLRESENFEKAIAAHLAALGGRASRHENAMRGLVAEVRVEPFRDAEGRIIGALGVALDVTERKRAEEVLRRRERQLLDAQRIGQVRVWEEDLRTGTVSTDHATLLGDPPLPNDPQPREEAWKLIHPDDLPRLLELRRRIIEGGGPFEAEFRMVRPDGVERVLFARGELQRDAEGKPERILGTAVDVTDRKRAEEALQRSERRLLDAQRLAHVGSWERDLRSNAVEMSEEARRIFFGDGPGQIRTYQEFLDHVHPDDRERLRQFRDVYLAGTAPPDIEYRVVGPEGAVRWIHGRVEVVRDASGEPVRVIGTNLDITERKRAADELRKTERLLLDAEALGHVGTWEYDFLSGKVYSSAENRRLFFGPGSSKGDRAEDYFEVVHPDDRERLARANEELAAGRGSPEIEFRVVWPDGSVHWILGYKQVVRDVRGQRVREIGTNADITDRKRAEEELHRRVRQQEAVAQLGQAALRGGDLTALFEEALRLITSACSLEFAEVGELLPDETMLLRAAVGWKERLVGHARFPAGRGSQCAFTLITDAPSVVEDFARETRFEVDPRILEQGMTSGVTVLIKGAGRPFGTLGMNSRERRTFTREDINFLQAAANVLAAAIERDRAQAELRAQREQMATLSHRLIEAQEAERRSVARELHDDFGQVLTALRFNLQKKKADLGESIELVDQAIGRMRDLALDLRPAILDDLGLAAALRWYVSREAQRAGLEPHLDIAEVEERLPPAVETTCFRLVQEALTNIARHARARSVRVTLTTGPEEVRLTVSDDGRGFDLAEARRRSAAGMSQGLVGMQERVSLAGGELIIDTAPGRGTTISARIPRRGGSGT